MTFDNRRRLVVRHIRRIPLSGCRLTHETTQGILFIRPQIRPWIDSLTEVCSSLIAALVDTRLERIEHPIFASISDCSKLKEAPGIFSLRFPSIHHATSVQN